MVKKQPAPSYDEFEKLARYEFERIPEQYRSGVDGLSVLRPALPHPSLPDVYTLGECVTETYPSDFGGPDTTRSLVVLHYGSFFRLSRIDPEFDWYQELWETLTHELQHHLESLADDDALVDMDYAANENYKRYDGETYDPLFFRHGIREGNWLRVEDEFFYEVERTDASQTTFNWRGMEYRTDIPDDPADVLLLAVTDGIVDPPGALHIAVVRRTGLLGSIAGLLRRRGPSVVEYEVAAHVES